MFIRRIGMYLGLKFIKNTKNAISSGKKQFFSIFGYLDRQFDPTSLWYLKFVLKSASFTVFKSTICFSIFSPIPPSYMLSSHKAKAKGKTWEENMARARCLVLKHRAFSWWLMGLWVVRWGNIGVAASTAGNGSQRADWKRRVFCVFRSLKN